MKSFLMIGQSNMAGRGGFDEVPEIKNDKCFMLRMGFWVDMSEPINPDRAVFNHKFHSGVGLAASFADEYAKYFDEDIGLIPCANGGTRLSQWMPGEDLYEYAVMSTKFAMKKSELAGILWHQGESDSVDLDCTEYKKNLIFMMNQLRKDLNAENIPIIMGEISENISPEYGINSAKEMNVTIKETAEELPLCVVAEAKELELKPDGIHFDSCSCRVLGRRYFEKYKEVVKCK